MDIPRVVLDGLAQDEDQLLAEQAVAGLDARDEVSLHAAIAGALETTGFGVLREVPFPSLSPEQKRDPQRKRCDIVLTPRQGQRVQDAIRGRRARAAAEGLLFAPDTGDVDAPPEDCLWLEIKCVGQFTYTQGVPGPNRSYTAELTGAVRRDVAKLSGDPLIRHGVALVLLFSESREVAEHDLGIAGNRALDRGVPIKAVQMEHAPIADRIGNRLMTAAVFEVGQG
ncbi:MAG: hypothetical protein KF805_09380 [Phycisphaeraceae bacterium]|nr:hypothetical protein [Phycisphaeraceae bacterium]